MQARRILSIDIIRGIGIMVIVVIHRIHYTWSGMRNNEVLRSYFSGPWAPVIIFTIALFTTAGIFYFISGLVNAHSMYSRVSSGKTGAIKAMTGGIAGGLWIFMMNYVQRIFFMNGFLASEPDADLTFPVGLLTGWIRNPHEVSFNWTQVTDPGTLALIGLVVVFVSLFLGLFLQCPRYFDKKKIYSILALLATIAFASSLLSKFYLRPYYSHLFETGRYFAAGCLGLICQEFGLLPYLGYGFIGAIIGIGLASNEDLKAFTKRSNIIAIVLIAAGLLSLLICDRRETFGSGCIGSGICCIELGLFVFIQKWSYKRYDLTTEDEFERRRSKTTGIRRFGMLALTVYTLEPVVAEIFRKITDLVLGNDWINHLQYVLVFGLFLLLFWWIFLRLWEKVRFKGSIEWLTSIVLLKFAGKKSGKTSFSNLKQR